MKFKVGDKVRVIANENRLWDIGVDRTRCGQEGNVIEINAECRFSEQGIPVRVQLADSDLCLNFAEQDLKLVEPETGTEALQQGISAIANQIRTFETGAKDTNPKDALGVKKVPLHCIPCGPLLELGLAMMEGGRKYGTHNYRAIGVRGSTYYNAALRHLMAYWEGEDIDPDSGVHHLTKAMACLIVWRDSQLMGNYEDDRPIQYRGGLKMAEANEQAAAIIEKYPECVAPFLADRTKPVSEGY